MSYELTEILCTQGLSAYSRKDAWRRVKQSYLPSRFPQSWAQHRTAPEDVRPDLLERLSDAWPLLGARRVEALHQTRRMDAATLLKTQRKSKT